MELLFGPGGRLHWIKNLYLRHTRGCGCCDVYSLYDYLAPRILNGLKVYKRSNHSHPGTLTEVKWDSMLDDMIFSFETIVAGKDGFSLKTKKERDRLARGLRLFGTWYMALWL